MMCLSLDSSLGALLFDALLLLLANESLALSSNSSADTTNYSHTCQHYLKT